MLAVGVSALGATFRAATVPGLVVTLLLGCACFTTLGIGAARHIARPENGMGILMIVTLPLMFISNNFFPLDNAPSWLQSVAGVFPVRPLADGLQVAFDPRTQGAGIVWHDTRTLIIWTVVGCVSMLQYMRSTNQRA
jgi:ABC-2 type transport system permease protein